MGAHSKVRSFKRARSILTVSLLTAAGLVWAAQPSLAVHDTGMFELDGNIVHDSATTPPYDWTSLFGASGNQLITPDPINGPVLASVFVDDTDAVDTTYFAGGTKIDDRVHDMACGGPAANDKTSMDYVYAALIQIPAGAPDNAGHQVLYLALEKQAAGNGGDNAFGFWLYKSAGVGCSGGGSFTGAHTDGDIWINGTFTNGGGASNIQVFRWNGNDITGSLGGAPVATGNVCGAVANDQQCAIGNDTAVISSGPWRSSPTMATDTFVEAGIDMTALLGASGGCFSSFLADSQSSQSASSQPKDYAGGTLNTCVAPNIATTATPGGSLNPPGVANQHDVATVSPVGGRPTPTGSVTFFLCSPAQVTAGGCVSGGTQVGGAVNLVAGSGTSANASGSLTQTTGKYCWRAVYTPDVAASAYYVGGSHTDATTECFTVAHASPTIATQIAVNGANSPGLGFTTLGDTAQLSGFVGSVTGETVTFKLYGPFGVGVTPVCTAANLAPSFVQPTTGTLDASGAATASPSYVPTQAGAYVWVASYPGDTLNDPVSGTCSDANESATIVAAQINVAKSANPGGPVSAGDNIGFDITVTNTGSVPAQNTTVTDNLPAKADGNAGGTLNWSI
ncbi:MAG: hypothetical protein QOI15_2934, partial [Pseudonocardiales bacterium]|nr:hypothetical protein [Pseudonocardiales bacterium]